MSTYLTDNELTLGIEPGTVQGTGPVTGTVPETVQGTGSVTGTVPETVQGTGSVTGTVPGTVPELSTRPAGPSTGPSTGPATTNYNVEGNIATEDFSTDCDAIVGEMDDIPFKYLYALLDAGDEYAIESHIDDMRESIISPSYYDDYSVADLRDYWVRESNDDELVADSVYAAYSSIFYDGGSELIDDLYDGYYSEMKYDGFSMTKVEFQLLATAALADAILDSEKKRRTNNAYYGAYYEGDYYSRNRVANKAEWDREQSLVGIKGDFLQAVVDFHYTQMESAISPSEKGAVLQKLPGEAQGVVPVN